ncbi:MAG: N-acetylmuramoyl-L-alanine amidase [Clostridiales bacterium]|nr:N-acetylmuramoyl-L-alanine amidase [Candidatus Blautia equi]
MKKRKNVQMITALMLCGCLSGMGMAAGVNCAAEEAAQTADIEELDITEESDLIVEDDLIKESAAEEAENMDYEEIFLEGEWEWAGNAAIFDDPARLYYADESIRKDITICVNAGHGTPGGASVKTLCHPDGSPKVTGGSTAEGAIMATAVSSGTELLDGTPECEVNLALALVLKDKLLAKGYNVLMIREDNETRLDNISRTLIANHYADCHIALHYDSSENDKGAFYISVPSSSSYRSMYPVSEHWEAHNALGEALIGKMGEAGVKIFSSGSMEIDLTQTSYSTIPSVDLEVGDRGSTHTALDHERLAEGIAMGLDAYFINTKDEVEEK